MIIDVKPFIILHIDARYGKKYSLSILTVEILYDEQVILMPWTWKLSNI